MKKFLSFILLFFSTACIKNNVERVRIVDAQGRPAKINKIIPQFNEEQMVKQREAMNNPSNRNIEVNRFRQDAMQPVNGDISMDTQPSSIKYSSDVFADRITNYNYIQDEIPEQTKTQKATKNNDIIEGDIIENKVTPTTTKPKNTTVVAPVVTNTSVQNRANQKGYYIQIGVYKEKINADSAYNKYSKINKGVVEEYGVKNKKQYKVLLGPYPNRNSAEKDLEKVIKTGHYDVYVTEKK